MFLKPNISSERVSEIIRDCMDEAEVAIKEGNIPMACIITDFEGNEQVRAHNTQNTENDPSAHAEINALRKMGLKKSSRFLEGYVLFSNAESCSMCASCAIKAKMRYFYYGAAAEQTMDPYVPLSELASKSKDAINIVGGILANECARQIAQGRVKIASANSLRK